MKPTRREFLSQAAMAIAALHAPLLTISATAQAPAVPKVRLTAVRLRANNLAEQKEYYGGVLGFPIEVSSDDVLRVRTGESSLEFSADAAVPRPYYHFAFTIPENQLESAMSWLETRSPAVPLNPRGDRVMHFKNWNAHSTYFTDPAGNILEFIAHHDLQNGASGDFSIDRVVRVSEIGVVVSDVPAFQAEAKSRMGLSAYRGSGAAFAPLGDIGGLLIVVKEGRIWLGSDKVPAQVFPTDVQLESEHSDRQYHVPGHPYRIAY